MKGPLALDLNEGAQQHGLRQGPNGYNNWAGNTPIQEFVDDYEMMDGTKFDWNNPAHKSRSLCKSGNPVSMCRYFTMVRPGNPAAKQPIPLMKYKLELILSVQIKLMVLIPGRVQ